MSTPRNLQEFFDENVSLVKEYLETKSSMYKLKAIRSTSKVAGTIIWLIIASFLFFLLLMFIGLVLGLWFSELCGSYVAGFGYATLLLFIIIIMLTLFRKQLFIHPLIRLFIGTMSNDEHKDDIQEAEDEI